MRNVDRALDRVPPASAAYARQVIAGVWRQARAEVAVALRERDEWRRRCNFLESRIHALEIRLAHFTEPRHGNFHA